MSWDDPDNPITHKEAYDGDYWRRKAKPTVGKAQNASNEKNRKRMLRVAVEYQKLAERADSVREQMDQMDD